MPVSRRPKRNGLDTGNLRALTGSTNKAPYSMNGTAYTDCIALEQTHNSIKAFEDEVSGHAFDTRN